MEAHDLFSCRHISQHSQLTLLCRQQLRCGAQVHARQTRNQRGSRTAVCRRALNQEYHVEPKRESSLRPFQSAVAACQGRKLELWPCIALVATVFAASAASPDAVSAWQIRQEPSNALSIPTWAIHVSSVYEWGLAMGLMWKYADVTGNPRWKGMTWGMVPLLGGAFAACTFHFFYNSEDVGFLVPLQAFLTFAGNTTLAIAAYRIYAAAEKPAEP